MHMHLIPWRNKRRDEIESRHPSRVSGALENVFGRLFQDPFTAGLPALFRDEFNWGPALDLSETDQQITVRVEAPGMNPDDIDIHVAGQVLTVRGEKRAEHQDQRGGVHYTERRFGEFSRSLTLPTRVDAEKIDATYKDGILTIVLDKDPGSQPRRVPIKPQAGEPKKR